MCTATAFAYISTCAVRPSGSVWQANMQNALSKKPMHEQIDKECNESGLPLNVARYFVFLFVCFIFFILFFCVCRFNLIVTLSSHCDKSVTTHILCVHSITHEREHGRVRACNANISRPTPSPATAAASQHYIGRYVSERVRPRSSADCLRAVRTRCASKCQRIVFVPRQVFAFGVVECTPNRLFVHAGTSALTRLRWS